MPSFDPDDHDDLLDEDVVDPTSPEVAPDAEVDPHWLQLRGNSPLPLIYMPPAMPGTHQPWTRAVALVLVAIFVGATAAGICLTYGPGF
jgi:hypothetical protein